MRGDKVQQALGFFEWSEKEEKGKLHNCCVGFRRDAAAVIFFGGIGEREDARKVLEEMGTALWFFCCNGEVIRRRCGPLRSNGLIVVN